MNAADIAALRTLLGRAKAAGWYRLSLGNAMKDGRTWRRHVRQSFVGRGMYVDQVDLFDGVLTVEPHDARDSWVVPATSVAQVTTVLELAGALPAAEVGATFTREQVDRAVRLAEDRNGKPRDWHIFIDSIDDPDGGE